MNTKEEQTQGDAKAKKKAPIWYSTDEIYHWLIRHDYSKNIASELSERIANSLQGSFKKGYEKGIKSTESELQSLRDQLAAKEKDISWLLEILEPFENMEALGPLESFRMREIKNGIVSDDTKWQTERNIELGKLRVEVEKLKDSLRWALDTMDEPNPNAISGDYMEYCKARKLTT